MADQYVIAGLKAKRTEMAGVIEHHQSELTRLTRSLLHLDETLRLFAPDIKIESLPVKTYRDGYFLFESGECQRMVLDIMRENGGNMTSRQITEEIIQRKDWEMSQQMIIRVQKSVISSADTLIRRGIVDELAVQDGSVLRKGSRLWRIA